MKKKVEICYQCNKSKCNNTLLWCSCDDFNLQCDVSERKIEFEEILPPKNCLYKLEHTVLTQ